MVFFNSQHQFYCGIDLHARTMYLCIVNQDGDILLHKNIPCEPELFKNEISSFNSDIVVGAECVFTWYWLADLCEELHIDFILGHALLGAAYIPKLYALSPTSRPYNGGGHIEYFEKGCRIPLDL